MTNLTPLNNVWIDTCKECDNDGRLFQVCKGNKSCDTVTITTRDVGEAKSICQKQLRRNVITQA